MATVTRTTTRKNAVSAAVGGGVPHHSKSFLFHLQLSVEALTRTGVPDNGKRQSSKLPHR